MRFDNLIQECVGKNRGKQQPPLLQQANVIKEQQTVRYAMPDNELYLYLKLLFFIDMRQKIFVSKSTDKPLNYAFINAIT